MEAIHVHFGWKLSNEEIKNNVLIKDDETVKYYKELLQVASDRRQWLDFLVDNQRIHTGGFLTTIPTERMTSTLTTKSQKGLKKQQD